MSVLFKNTAIHSKGMQAGVSYPTEILVEKCCFEKVV